MLPILSGSAPVLAVTSALLMATYGVIFKLTNLPAETLAFARLFLGAGFLAVYLLIRGQFCSVITRLSRQSLLTGICLSGFIILYVKALNYTSMANAVMTIYMAPMIALLVSHFLFNERLNLKRSVLIMGAFWGLVMMQEQVVLTGFFSIGLLYSLLAAVFYAGFILLNKYPLKPEHQNSHTLHQLLFGSVIILPFIFGQDFEFSPFQWAGLILAGLLPGCLATILAVYALQRMETSLFSILIYIEPIAVLLFGWTIFSEQLNSQQLTGMLIILICGVMIIPLSKNKKSAPD